MDKLKELEEWVENAFQACQHASNEYFKQKEYEDCAMFDGKCRAFKEVLTKIKELKDEIK
jgi:hypothetical protein